MNRYWANAIIINNEGVPIRLFTEHCTLNRDKAIEIIDYWIKQCREDNFTPLISWIDVEYLNDNRKRISKRIIDKNEYNNIVLKYGGN